MEPVAGSSATSTDSKPCPACGEPIRSSALKCRFCGEDIEAFLAKREGAVENAEAERFVDVLGGDGSRTRDVCDRPSNADTLRVRPRRQSMRRHGFGEEPSRRRIELAHAVGVAR